MKIPDIIVFFSSAEGLISALEAEKWGPAKLPEIF